MLLADRERPLLPLTPDLRVGPEDELSQHGFEAERGEAFVQYRMHGGLVVGADRRQQAFSRVLEQALEGRALARAARAASAARESLIETLLHAPDALGVLGGVEPKATGRADRVEQPVPALPGAEHRGADTHPAGELADPKTLCGKRHKIIIRTLDKTLTGPPRTSYFVQSSSNVCIRRPR